MFDLGSFPAADRNAVGSTFREAFSVNFEVSSPASHFWNSKDSADFQLMEFVNKTLLNLPKDT
jgi:hypothetical protein